MILRFSWWRISDENQALDPVRKKMKSYTKLIGI